MREVYVKDTLLDLFNLLVEHGTEVYISQDGLTKDVEYNNVTYRISCYVTSDEFILVDSIHVLYK